MEIIRRGTPTCEEIWEGRCRRCGSVAQCQRSELTNITPGCQRSPGEFSWEICPVCNAGHGPPVYGGMIFYKKSS